MGLCGTENCGKTNEEGGGMIMHEGGILGWKQRELGAGEKPSFHLPLEVEAGFGFL